MIGSVYALKYDKNYGFIYVDGGEQYFFHRNELRNCTMYQLNEGDVVEFDTKEYNDKIRAANVRKKYQAEPKANMANPGINPMVKMEHFNEDEKRIIKAR